MKHAKPVVLTAMLALFPPALAAGEMSDICHVRAKDASGYKGLRPLVLSDGKVQIRLSGSVALGVSHSKGSGATPRSPAFAGSHSVEQREGASYRAYVSSYSSCMAES